MPDSQSRGNAWHACAIDRGGCVSCGSTAFGRRAVIDDALADTWGLSPTERAWFDDREGHHCLGCGMSRRVRMLLWTLRRLVPELAGLDLLHVNQINHLRPSLAAANVVDTVYRPAAPAGMALDGAVNQDLMAMTFPDRSFDVAVHSETLEHVDRPDRALAEIARVLRREGRQIYTVPLLLDRPSRRRARLRVGGRPVHLAPPSFHGCAGEDLVFWELGGDFLTRRRPAIESVFWDDRARNPTVFAVVERR